MTLRHDKARPPFNKSMPAGWYAIRVALSVLGFLAIYLTHCLAVRFSNQRLGNGQPNRKPGPAAILRRMWSALHEQPAVYPAFERQTTMVSSSLEDLISGATQSYNCVPETTTMTAYGLTAWSWRLGSLLILSMGLPFYIKQGHSILFQ